MNLSFNIWLLAFFVIGFVICKPDTGGQQIEDNEFAEFDDPDDVSTPQGDLKFNKASAKSDAQQQDAASSDNQKPDSKAQEPESKVKEEIRKEESKDSEKNTDDEDSTLETEEDEFSHLHDTEEFEGYDKDRMSTTKNKENVLNIAKVPPHLTTSWENFYLEIIMLTGMVVYFLNFLVGKTKNARLANAWFSAHKELLEANFSIVGDDGQAMPNTGTLTKDSEHVYSLWCSGRICCEGMLVELKFLKRQDLVSVISRWLKPAYDTVVVKITLDDIDVDGFVMALAPRKRLNALMREYQDLITFCADKKTTKHNIPDSFSMTSEIGEASTALMDATVCKFLRDFEDNIDYLHFSDQFSGPKLPQEDPQSGKLPEVENVLIFSYKVGRKGMTTVSDMESMLPLFKFVFYIMDKVKRIKLSKEAKLKSEKNRQKAMDGYQKQVHSQRQEAAQVRREEKRRQEKEKLMAEEDPDKARRLEALDSKREAKRKQPKMKMLKVKGM